ncbi:hypothetical protein E0F15_17805 [Frankia sp. B2]|uniref:hypothetical protein n=1 Tax=unclassified Frankia TaxID=2632575 RepID=UPI0006C9F841|nr:MULTISPECIES: hypothetical protein [unclassified Frankia]KPM52709.1 hypothetical protein ACG83_24820 [Frankia sp. R43]TFE26493.1 hypothetical protein E0F15_17805 [Frankia sp. B2]
MFRTVHRTILPGFRNYGYEVRQGGEAIETGEIVNTGNLATVRPTDGQRRPPILWYHTEREALQALARERNAIYVG